MSKAKSRFSYGDGTQSADADTVARQRAANYKALYGVTTSDKILRSQELDAWTSHSPDYVVDMFPDRAKCNQRGGAMNIKHCYFTVTGSARQVHTYLDDEGQPIGWATGWTGHSLDEIMAECARRVRLWEAFTGQSAYRIEVTLVSQRKTPEPDTPGSPRPLPGQPPPQGTCIRSRPSTPPTPDHSGAPVAVRQTAQW